MSRVLISLLTAWILFLGTGLPFSVHPASVLAEDNWKKEFDDICGQTADAMGLSKDEVKTLIERCDKLKPRIEQLDESTKKVYLSRLRTCRNLFVFVLESGTN